MRAQNAKTRGGGFAGGRRDRVELLHARTGPRLADVNERGMHVWIANRLDGFAGRFMHVQGGDALLCIVVVRFQVLLDQGVEQLLPVGSKNALVEENLAEALG